MMETKIFDILNGKLEEEVKSRMDLKALKRIKTREKKDRAELVRLLERRTS